jgi:hypothetical protein
MARVLVDTSAWFAINNPSDKYAPQASTYLLSDPQLITTNFIIDETITLTLNRSGYASALKVGNKLWSGKLATIIYLTEADQRAAWDLFKRYDDKKFSFTDCTSFAVMLRLGLTEAFTFDQDFKQSGLFTIAP